MYSSFLKFGFIFLVFFQLKVIAQKKQDKLELSSVFSDHMVLQQKTKVVFWGKSKPDNEITVSGSWGETNSILSDNKGSRIKSVSSFEKLSTITISQFEKV